MDGNGCSEDRARNAYSSAVNTFHAAVIDWGCRCVAMQAPTHPQTSSNTSIPLQNLVVHHGFHQTRQTVLLSLAL